MKQWKSVIAIAAVFTAFNAANASAQGVGFLVGGGLTVPTGDLSDVVNTGFNVGVGLDIVLPASPVDFRVEGTFTQFSIDDTDSNWRIINGGAAALLNLPMVGATPYLIGGAGIYSQSITDSDFDSETDLGINIGAGVTIPLVGIRGVFGEARFHNIFTEESSTNYISFTVGVKL